MRSGCRLLATAIALLATAQLLVACQARPASPPASETPSPAPGSAWERLLQRTPNPYTTPLPPAEEGPADGWYAKFDPNPPQYWACKRCADYRPTGGVWWLQLDRGIMRLYYAVTEWAISASYAVDAERMTLFNDGVCPDAIGEYTWRRDEIGLSLSVIDDPCAIGLRAENLTRQPWRSCEPIQGREVPEECRALEADGQGTVAEGLSVTVQVREGDVRHGDDPPHFFAHANQYDIPPPNNVRISESPDSLGFGVNRVLWGKEQWIEATTELPIESFGVQFLGEHVIGWARVLFDGVEVWRGDTSQIWSKGNVYGGYVEVSGFGDGAHTLRVESLAVGGRAVMVSFFGFGQSPGR